MISLSKFEHVVFDLDRTVWDTYDRFNTLIWAKQLVFPLSFNDAGHVVDDVGSVCILRPGITNFLSELFESGKLISFLSVGGIKARQPGFQPSLILLQMFDIGKYFEGDRLLLYKTCPKVGALSCTKSTIMFDDNAKTRDELNSQTDVRAVSDLRSYPGKYHV